MEVKNMSYRFDQAVSHFPARIRDPLLELPATDKDTAVEVRLRVDKPVVLGCTGSSWFIDENGQLHNIPAPGFAVTPQELEETVLTMCSYSVHAHQNELKNGYISLRGGHRAGVCGTAVVDGGRITAIREITSINLRIARDVVGAAKDLVKALYLKKKLCSVLVAGVPSSGKTTILRDLARQLADGSTGRYYKVAVVDERGEIGAVFEGVPQNDLGVGCDVLSAYPKGEGILMAVRTLSPHVVVCDEIGAEEEVTGMLDGLRCGVKIVASAHAETLDELLGRRQIIRLLQEGAFDNIVMLGGADHPGEVADIIGMEDLRYEDGGYVVDRALLHDDGDFHGVEFVRKGAQD